MLCRHCQTILRNDRAVFHIASPLLLRFVEAARGALPSVPRVSGSGVGNEKHMQALQNDIPQMIEQHL